MNTHDYEVLAEAFGLSLADTADDTARSTVLRVLGNVTRMLTETYPRFRQGNFVGQVYENEVLIRRRRLSQS
jgi:hypothetical protein